jgi:hypothetical protein
VPARPRRWDEAAKRLSAEIGDRRVRQVDFAVSLSDHFVRYAVLPWQKGLRGMSDWEGYARHELEQRYGKSDSARTVRVAPGRAGEARLAAAVDDDLLETLRSIAAQHQSRLASVEANLCRVAERTRRLHRKVSLLAVIEPGRVSLMEARNRELHDVASVRSGADACQTLLMLLAERRMRAEAEDRSIACWGVLGDGLGALRDHGYAPFVPQAPQRLPVTCLNLGLI